MIFQYKIRHFAMASILLSLSACSPDELQQQAGLDATNSNENVHRDYLSCYALDDSRKKACTAKLADKYLRTNKDDKEYVQEFQYECEKQGFKKFLTEQEVKCNAINEGPEFIEDQQAYQVKCQPDKEYFMQFDYKNKTWKLIK